MATHTLTAGQQGKHDFTLAADVVDTVTFPDDVGMVQIVTDGAAKVYYTTDGSTPTVGGANTLVIPGSPVPEKRRTVPRMATHERVTLVCDGCGSEDESVRTVTLRRDRKKTRYVEACGSCLEPINKLIDAGRTDPSPPVSTSA